MKTIANITVISLLTVLFTSSCTIEKRATIQDSNYEAIAELMLVKSKENTLVASVHLNPNPGISQLNPLSTILLNKSRSENAREDSYKPRKNKFKQSRKRQKKRCKQSRKRQKNHCKHSRNQLGAGWITLIIIGDILSHGSW
jgi:hypothetical protein